MQVAAQIIADARKTNAYTALHRQEIVFLCQYPYLNEAQKIQWLWLTHRSARDPTRGFQRAQATIGKKLGKGRAAVYLAFEALKVFGFVESRAKHNHASCYFAMLPPDGLHALSQDIHPRYRDKTCRTLLDFRKYGHYSCFCVEELDFVLEHPDLTDLEKLTWCLLANQGGGMKKLTVRYSFKALAALLLKQENTMAKVVRSLQRQGFLKVEEDRESFRHWFSLCLPEEGLSLVKAAPPRAGKKKSALSDVLATQDTPVIFFTPRHDEKAPPYDETAYPEDESVHRQDAIAYQDDESIHSCIPDPNSCNKETITTNMSSSVFKLASVSSSGSMRPTDRLSTNTLKEEASILQAEALGKGLHSSPVGDSDNMPDIAPCIIQQPWAIPIPDPYRPPILDGSNPIYHDKVPLSKKVATYWFQSGAIRRKMPDAPWPEADRFFELRALRSPEIDPAPFAQSSPYRNLSEEACAAAITENRALLDIPLCPNGTRYWCHRFVERSHQLGFGGELNFYVFDSFDPLPQLLIRRAMRSPTPPPLLQRPAAAPPVHKAKYGTYPIHDTLIYRIEKDVPRFVKEDEFDEKVAQRGAIALISEILFYVASKPSAPEQTDLLEAAYMICRKGAWNTPIGFHAWAAKHA